MITCLKDAGFIVGRDDMSIFIDKEGQPTKKHPVKWTDIPIASGKLNHYYSHQVHVFWLAVLAVVRNYP